jgi:hypothetical protein
MFEVTKSSTHRDDVDPCKSKIEGRRHGQASAPTASECFSQPIVVCC